MKNNRVRLRVPLDSSTIVAASGDVVMVTLEAGERWAELLLDDARLLLNSGLPDNLPWRELNPHLVNMLGPIPKEHPGIPWSQVRQPAEDARPTHWSDKGRIANQAIAALTRARAR